LTPARGENSHPLSIWETPGSLPVDDDPVRSPLAYLVDHGFFGVAFAHEASSSLG